MLRSIILSFFIAVLLMPVSSAWSQPMLPDIAGAAEGDIVMLTWQCQYKSIKSVAVKRSADSMGDYQVIGYVGQTPEGFQAFADGHPFQGHNYYKLSIEFKSGVKWTSNKCHVQVDAAGVGQLPDNQYLQQFVRTEELIERTPVGGVRQLANLHTKYSVKTTRPGHIVFRFFEEDTLERPAESLRVSLKLPAADSTIHAIPVHLAVNQSSGHVVVKLPEDAKKRRYSIQFFNDEHQAFIEVPYIKHPTVIIDKRNFQRSGRYKFVLKKEGIVIEIGYVAVALSGSR